MRAITPGMAIIEFRPGRYTSRFVFFGGQLADGKRFDFLGCLWRDPGEAWHFTSRIRWYDTEGLDGPDKDRKTVFEGTLPAETSEAEAVARSATIWELAARTLPGCEEPDVLTIESDDPDEAMRQIGSRSWAHLRTEHDRPAGQA
jgi:hypothetical protein